MSVLIVEDDRVFVELLQQALGPGPRLVRVACCMREALQLVGESTPEIIMLDLLLPDSPVQETLARIGEFKDRAKNATIIVITGHLEVSVRTEAIRRGADYCLSKDKSIFRNISATLSFAHEHEHEHGLNPTANEKTITEIERRVAKIVLPAKP